MINQQTPIMVEIVGVAGAGKSTLSRLLARQPGIVAGEYIRVKNVQRLPHIVQSLLPSLRIYLNSGSDDRPITWEEIKKVAYLRGWHTVLQQQGRQQQAVVLIDQGPVFELATLYEFGPHRFKSHRLAAWWEEMFAQWASALHLIVWLKAPNEVLLRRIRTRRQWHMVKDSPTQVAQDFLDRYQRAYEHVIANLLAAQPIRVQYFDTSRESTESIMTQVLTVIDQVEHTLPFDHL